MILKDVENQIDDFVFKLTSLKALEFDGEERYTLTLGLFDPIVLSFSKEKHPKHTNFRYSAHVKLLSIISDLLKEDEFFLAWIKKNKDLERAN